MLIALLCYIAKWRVGSGVVDLSNARHDGSLTVTAGGQLFLLQPTGTLRAFARGPGGYATNPGAEAYLALAPRRRVPGAHCAFRRDDVYALEVAPPGVVVVDASGQARPFAALPADTSPTGSPSTRSAASAIACW
jgi:hypothetical protein